MKHKRASLDGLHLAQIDLREVPTSRQAAFPFNIPVIQDFEGLPLTQAVTLFVGENGSGKSTLLEGLACAAGSVAVGSENLANDQSLSAGRELAKYLRLSWRKRTHRGFFLRAEDFFGYAQRMSQLRAEMEAELKRVEDEYQGRSKLAQDLARSPYFNEREALERRYGPGLDNVSHGESFLALFQARFVPDGLYLLDEPEAPLSPLRQLALIAMLKEMVAQQAQFIIATHSPILMAYPGATIYSFDEGQIRPVDYADLEAVNLMRSFLENPQAYLQHL